MRSWNWMLAALIAAAVAPPALAQADPREELLAFVLRDAERDFDRVRDAAALSGSAPLVGLKAEKKAPARKHAKRAGVKTAKATDEYGVKSQTAFETRPSVEGRP